MRKILLLLFFLPNFLFSQNFSFLSQESEAKHIAVDKDFYWVGTDNSLYQYSKEDGQLCGIFNKSNSLITQIVVMDTDREGNLYVCTGSRLVRFENFEWVDYDTCSSTVSGFAFDENNEVSKTFYWRYTSSFCSGSPLIGFSEVKRGLTFSYGKFNWFFCGGSSSGCGCIQKEPVIRKTGSYSDEALLLSFPAYEEGYPDVLGNFWKSENNQLSTVFSPIGMELNDVIESDTTFDLVGFTLQNHKVLENPDLGRFIYNGSSYNFLHSVPSFPIAASFEDYEHKMFYLSEDKTPMAYIDDAWMSLEKPEGIPFTEFSLINSKGDNFWFEHENWTSFALVSPTDYFYFTPLTDGLPDFIPSLKINNIANEIWRFYSETETLWRHNGTEWSDYQATDLGLEEWELTEYRISENGNLWFPLVDNPTAYFAEFNMPAQDWTVHNDSISYAENFITNADFWFLDSDAFYHVLGQDTTVYPFPPSLNIGSLRHINQSGHGWVSRSPYSYNPMYYFDGENFIEGEGFGGTSFASFSRNDTLYMLNRPEYTHQIDPEIYYRKYVGSELVFSDILAIANVASSHPYYHSVSSSLFDFDENGDLIIQFNVIWKTGLTSPPPVGYISVLDTKTFSNDVIVPNPTFPQNFSIENAFFDDNNKLWSFDENIGFACPYPLAPQNFFFGKSGDCSTPNYLLTGTLQGTNENVSYLWNDGDTSAYRLSIEEGNYTVSVNNDLGGIEVFDTTIEPIELIEVEAIITDISEVNAADGAIELNATSNFPPLSINWNTGETTFTIDELTFGNYSATITDGNGCELVENYVVGGDSLVMQAEVLHNIDCQGNDSGSVAINFPLSVPANYEVLWSDGSNGDIVENLEAGTGYVTVYSYTGQTLNDTFYISDTAIDFFGDFETDISSSESATDGTGSIFPTGGELPYSYLWDDGNTNATNENLSAGIHYLTVTDANDCFFVDSIQIFSQISVSTNVLEQPICEGDETGIIEINVTGGTGIYEISIPTSDLNIAENIPTGTSSFSVIPEIGDTVNYEVNIEPLSPPMDITVEATLLSSEYGISPIVTGGTPPFTYHWVTGETADTLYTSNTIFVSQLTATDAMGCEESTLVNINLPLISGIEDNFVSDFQVFPNPTFDFINITLSKDIQVIKSLKIVNIQGKEVLVDLVNEGGDISKDISHLPAGVYYVLLENEQQILRGKFVKM